MAIKLRVTPLHERRVEKNEPFAGDAFERETFAKNLTRLFKNSDEGLVISVEAKWGEGKTTFLRMWESLLESDREFVPVYYNAFNNDFSNDPFVSIAASIYAALKDRVSSRRTAKKTNAQLDHLKEKSKDLAIGLAQMSADLAMGFLSGGLVSHERLEKLLKQASTDFFVETFRVKAEEKFEAYLHADDAVKDYQETLHRLLVHDEKEPAEKVVVFVDELDRCRPAFAVEIIEKIKHLFNIPNVFFVLAINREQLLSTIEHVYGVNKDDGRIYFEKFIDFTTRLPRTSTRNERDPAKGVGGMLCELSRQLDLDDGPLSITEELSSLEDLIGRLGLTLRSIEKVMTLISLGLNSLETAEGQKLRKFIVFASAFRVGDPGYFESIRGGGFNSSLDEGRYIFDWAKKTFEQEGKSTASNIFEVSGMKEACRVLEMYEIPYSGREGEESP